MKLQKPEVMTMTLLENVFKILVEKEEEEFLDSLTDGATSVRYNYIPFDQFKDFIIRADFQYIGNNPDAVFGLLLGFKDSENFQLFIISEKGAFFIEEIYDGYIQNDMEWESSPEVKTGNNLNRLELIKKGDGFYFSINEELVRTTRSSSFQNLNFGIFASGTGEFILSNLIVIEVSEE